MHQYLQPGTRFWTWWQIKPQRNTSGCYGDELSCTCLCMATTTFTEKGGGVRGGTQEDSTPESEVLVASFSWRLRITSNSSEPELLWRHREEEDEEEVVVVKSEEKKVVVKGRGEIRKMKGRGWRECRKTSDELPWQPLTRMMWMNTEYMQNTDCGGACWEMESYSGF